MDLLDSVREDVRQLEQSLAKARANLRILESHFDGMVENAVEDEDGVNNDTPTSVSQNGDFNDHMQMEGYEDHAIAAEDNVQEDETDNLRRRTRAQRENDVRGSGTEDETSIWITSDDDAQTQDNPETPIRRTLSQLRIWRDDGAGTKSIWGFKEQKWMTWKPRKTRESSMKKHQNVILDAAKKILRVQYFTRHLCEADFLNSWIPRTAILEVFTLDEWNTKIYRFRKRIHFSVLTQALQAYLSRWKKHSNYPSKSFNPNESSQDKSDRMRAWSILIQAYPDDLIKFWNAVAESVNWEIMCMKVTEDDRECYEWGLNCIASMLEVLYRMGEGSGHNRAIASERNNEWEALEEAGRPDYNKVLLMDNFGRGGGRGNGFKAYRKRRREEASKKKLPGTLADNPIDISDDSENGNGAEDENENEEDSDTEPISKRQARGNKAASMIQEYDSESDDERDAEEIRRVKNME